MITGNYCDHLTSCDRSIVIILTRNQGLMFYEQKETLHIRTRKLIAELLFDELLSIGCLINTESWNMDSFYCKATPFLFVGLRYTN